MLSFAYWANLVNENKGMVIVAVPITILFGWFFHKFILMPIIGSFTDRLGHFEEKITLTMDGHSKITNANISNLRAELKANSDEHFELKSGVSDLSKHITELKIINEKHKKVFGSITQEHLEVIKAEIKTTTKLALIATIKATMEETEPVTIDSCKRILNATGEVVQKRRNDEYDYFAKSGMAENLITKCREVDKELLPDMTIALQELMHRVDKHKGKDSADELIELEKHKIMSMFSASWIDKFSGKFTIRS